MEKKSIKTVAELKDFTLMRYKERKNSLRGNVWEAVSGLIINELLEKDDILSAACLSIEKYFTTKTYHNASIAVVLNTIVGNNSIAKIIIKDIYSRDRSSVEEKSHQNDSFLYLFNQICSEFEKNHNLEINGIETLGMKAFSSVGRSEDLNKWPSSEINWNNKVNRLLVDTFYKINNQVKIKKIKKINSVLSIGSCFAVNIDRSLKKNNINSDVIQINEQLNNTVAIHKISQILSTNLPIEKINLGFNLSENSINLMKKRFTECSLCIVTLGVSIDYIDKSTGLSYTGYDLAKRIALGEVIQKTLSIKESYDLINKINNLIAFDSRTVVYSLSPVPLIRTFNKNSNILLDDIASKLNLRSAILEVIEKNNNVIYWPSFEIIKWFGAHFKSFGDDNDSRHVNDNLVDLITENFINIFFEK